MPSLSVVMIMRDEAHCLARCLDSVRAIADEIVIADTGSSDDSIAIAEDRGALVFPFRWQDDFAAARNAVLERASGGWLLHLDADEALDEAGARETRRLVDADGEGADAFEITLANYCNDPRAWRWTPAPPDAPHAQGYAGYVATTLLRLFRNRRGFRYDEPVHENITASVHAAGGLVRPASVLIHHYGFDPGAPRHAAKAERYLAIARRKTELRPRDPKAWHDYAEQSLACGGPREAEQACRKALALAPGWLPAAITLGNLLLNAGRRQEARETLEEIAANPDAPAHVWVALAALDLREGRHGDARRRLGRAREIDPANVMEALYRARLLDLEGDEAAAADCLAELAARHPAIAEIQERRKAIVGRQEARQAYLSGKPREALAAAVAALGRDPEDPLMHNDIGVILHELGDANAARASFQRALKLAEGYEAARQNLAAP